MCVRGVMDATNRVQIQEKTICFSHNANTKVLIKLFSLKSKRADCLFKLGMATYLGEVKLRIKTC